MKPAMDAMKKKPSLAEAMVKSKPAESEDDEAGEFDTAADELFEALKDDDRASFKSALRACMSCK